MKDGAGLGAVIGILDRNGVMELCSMDEAEVGWAEFGEIAKAGGDPAAFAEAGVWHPDALAAALETAEAGIGVQGLEDAFKKDPDIAAGLAELAFCRL